MSFSDDRGGTRTYLLGHSLLDRLAYRRLLTAEARTEVSVDSDFSPTAVWAALRTRPDLVIVTADAATSDVIDAVQVIMRLRPECRVLVVSAAIEPARVEAWGLCPLQGYVVKDGGIEELRAAVAAVLAGRTYYSEGVRRALDRGSARAHEPQRLSRRETELLPLLARGMTLREAAARMAVSYKTADSYRTSLLRKLGVHDRVELARYAIRAGVIEP